MKGSTRVFSSVCICLLTAFLTCNVIADNELPTTGSPLTPGTTIVPGDLSRDEFFIVAENDVKQLKTAINQADTKSIEATKAAPITVTANKSTPPTIPRIKKRDKTTKLSVVHHQQKHPQLTSKLAMNRMDKVLTKAMDSAMLNHVIKTNKHPNRKIALNKLPHASKIHKPSHTKKIAKANVLSSHHSSLPKKSMLVDINKAHKKVHKVTNTVKIAKNNEQKKIVISKKKNQHGVKVALNQRDKHKFRLKKPTTFIADKDKHAKISHKMKAVVDKDKIKSMNKVV